MTQISHRLDPGAPFEAIKTTLKANGICVLPNFLSSKKVVSLKDAVAELAYAEHTNQLSQGKSRLGRFSMDEIRANGRNEVADLICDDFYQNIANDFFSPYLPDFHKVYCHHDVDTMDFNNAWHFDRGLTLKFFFYLNDVTADNGAFCYDLGSHRHNAVKQHLWWEAKTPILNYVPEEEVKDPSVIDGPAGTLIIFDVSGFHQAGKIKIGRDRWILRYHVRAGKHSSNEPRHVNPYARRNWDYRSGCYSERTEDQLMPWGDLFQKPTQAIDRKKGVAKNKVGLLDGSKTRSARSILSALRNRLPG